MRALPYIAGAVAVVAIGGAVAGAAIDTTPRRIHDSVQTTGNNAIAFDNDDTSKIAPANHYRLETRDGTYEVAQLRERGLYSQDRYARRYTSYEDYTGGTAEDFDYDAAMADEPRYDRTQVRRTTRIAQRPRTTQRPLDLERPARVEQQSTITYVSEPVVQDTRTMQAR